MNDKTLRVGNCFLAALALMAAHRSLKVRAIWFFDAWTPHFYVKVGDGWRHFRHREDVVPDPCYWLLFRGSCETIAEERMARLLDRHAHRVVDMPFVDMGDPPCCPSGAIPLVDLDEDEYRVCLEERDLRCRLAVEALRSLGDHLRRYDSETAYHDCLMEDIEDLQGDIEEMIEGIDAELVEL